MRRLVLPLVLIGLALVASSVAALVRASAAGDAGSCVYLPLVAGSSSSAPAGPGQPFAGCVAPAAPAPDSTATAGSISPTSTVTSSSTPTDTATSTAEATATGTATSTATSTAPALPTPYAYTLSEVGLLPERPVTEITRRPVRLTFVLDVSGSMSANYAGQCDQTTLTQPRPPKGYWQCANGEVGTPPAEVENTGDRYYWSKAEERRIYAAKYALERIVRGMNLPGNPDYHAEFPADAVSVVWFNHEAGPANTTPYTSNVSVLIKGIRDAGAYDGEHYRTTGGSNLAAGLSRASLQLDAAPATVEFGGKSYDYEDRVVLVTGSVANFFLDTTKPSLGGPASDNDTYPADHPCRAVVAVRDDAPCQTTAVGGLTAGDGGVPAGWERPLTQAVLVSLGELQPRAEVLVATLGPVPSLGLTDGIASDPSLFYALRGLAVNPDGTTTMDEAVDDMSRMLYGRIVVGPCSAVAGPAWVKTIPPQHMPETFIVTPPTVGRVRLQHTETGAVYELPIRVTGATDSIRYSISDVPYGDYTISAYLFYRGDDGATRLYNRIEVDGKLYDQTTLSWDGRSIPFDPLLLRLGGNVCGAQ